MNWEIVQIIKSKGKQFQTELSPQYFVLRQVGKPGEWTATRRGTSTVWNHHDKTWRSFATRWRYNTARDQIRRWIVPYFVNSRWRLRSCSQSQYFLSTFLLCCDLEPASFHKSAVSYVKGASCHYFISCNSSHLYCGGKKSNTKKSRMQARM